MRNINKTFMWSAPAFFKQETPVPLDLASCSRIWLGTGSLQPQYFSTYAPPRMLVSCEYKEFFMRLDIPVINIDLQLF